MHAEEVRNAGIEVGTVQEFGGRVDVILGSVNQVLAAVMDIPFVMKSLSWDRVCAW